MRNSLLLLSLITVTGWGEPAHQAEPMTPMAPCRAEQSYMRLYFRRQAEAMDTRRSQRFRTTNPPHFWGA